MRAAAAWTRGPGWTRSRSPPRPAMNTGAGRRPMAIAPYEGPDMSHEPQIQARAAQHYAAIPATVATGGIAAAVDDTFPELFGWLAGQGIAPAGPPLIR